jgi:hypothetical protein
LTIKTPAAEGEFFPGSGIVGAVGENEVGELILLLEEVVGLGRRVPGGDRANW